MARQFAHTAHSAHSSPCRLRKYSPASLDLLHVQFTTPLALSSVATIHESVRELAHISSAAAGCSCLTPVTARSHLTSSRRPNMHSRIMNVWISPDRLTRRQAAPRIRACEGDSEISLCARFMIEGDIYLPRLDPAAQNLTADCAYVPAPPPPAPSFPRLVLVGKRACSLKRRCAQSGAGRRVT